MLRRWILAFAGRRMMQYMADPSRRSGNPLADAGNFLRLVGAAFLLLPGLIFGIIAAYQWIEFGNDHVVWATVSSIFALIFLVPAFKLLSARRRVKRKGTKPIRIR